MSDLSPPRPEAGSILQDDLRFPDGHGVELRTYTLTPDEVLRLSAVRLPLVTAWPGFEEERLRSKCRVPFVLPD